MLQAIHIKIKNLVVDKHEILYKLLVFNNEEQLLKVDQELCTTESE